MLTRRFNIMVDTLLIIFGWAIWVAFIAAIIHHKRSLKKYYNGNVPFKATILGRFLSIKSTRNIRRTPDYCTDPQYRYMHCNIYNSDRYRSK